MKLCINQYRTFYYYYYDYYLFSFVFVTGKRERSLISEQEKACAEKIAQLEESLKRKKQVEYDL